MPSGYDTFFTGVQWDFAQSAFYWSSTAIAGSPLYAWYVDLSSGFVYGDPDLTTLYVWPVRGGRRW